MNEQEIAEAKQRLAGADGVGLDHDPIAELRERHRYLQQRKSEVFPIPGYVGKFGMKLRALSRDELKEISANAMQLRRDGHEHWDLIDNTDTLLRATEAIMYRPEEGAAWKPLHELPSANTSTPIKFDQRLAELFEVADRIERGEHAEAESRQTLWLVFADTLQVEPAHNEYMLWRMFADEEVSDDVKAELRAELEDESLGEAGGAA